MTTTFCLRLRWLLLLWALVTATCFAPRTVFAYDAHQTTIAYDGSREAVVGYDAILEHVASETGNGTTGIRVFFAEFGKLLAAETTAGSRALVPYYPPNAGFAGASGEASLVPGTIVDRFGGTGGSFLSPQGTPAWARSLPFGAETRPLNTYEVLKPIDVNAGTAAPWFNQPGGGLQFDLGTRTVQDLIDSGHLRPIP